MHFNERGTAVAEKPFENLTEKSTRGIDCGTQEVGVVRDDSNGTVDMENRLGIDSLDVLHAKRRALVERSAHLRALHGRDGLFDPTRKRLLEALKVRHRMEMIQRGEKVTDNSVDAAAHADPAYERLIENGITDRVAWIVAENELADVSDRIANRTMEISVYNSESRLR